MRATFILILARGEWGRGWESIFGTLFLGFYLGNLEGCRGWCSMGNGEGFAPCKGQHASNIRTDSGKEWVMVGIGGRHGRF